MQGLAARLDGDLALHRLHGDRRVAVRVAAELDAEYRAAHDHGYVVHRHVEGLARGELFLNLRGHGAFEQFDGRFPTVRGGDGDLRAGFEVGVLVVVQLQGQAARVRDGQNVLFLKLHALVSGDFPGLPFAGHSGASGECDHRYAAVSGLAAGKQRGKKRGQNRERNIEPATPGFHPIPAFCPLRCTRERPRPCLSAE